VKVSVKTLSRMRTLLTTKPKEIRLTDDLIDQIVYKLYGLTEEEIAIVEGRVYFLGLDDRQILRTRVPTEEGAMSDTVKLLIRKMIVHKVDHKNYDAPLLSNLESPTTDEVGSFLREHIASNREHKRARTAKFLEPPDGTEATCTLCDDVLRHPDSFIQRSQETATRLFQTMTGDRRISAGDLVVCTFVESGNHDSEWLALLKMDPKDGFVGEREQVDGQTRVVLRRVPEVLPTGELQKCAFIVPLNLREERGYDLIVLDQQIARYGMRRLVASFFLKKFLQCKVGFQREEETRTFIYQSQAWVTKKEDTWPVQEIVRFKQRAIEAAQARVVDVTAFAQEVVSDPVEQDEYLAHMKREGLDELTFEPDPEERKRWTEYAWFRGDDDLLVRIRPEAVGEGNMDCLEGFIGALYLQKVDSAFQALSADGAAHPGRC